MSNINTDTNVQRLHYVLHRDGTIYDSGYIVLTEKGKPDILEVDGYHFISSYEELSPPPVNRTHHYRSAYIRSIAHAAPEER